MLEMLKALELNWHLPIHKVLRGLRERIRDMKLAACCNYFSKKKKKKSC